LSQTTLLHFKLSTSTLQQYYCNPPSHLGRKLVNEVLQQRQRQYAFALGIEMRPHFFEQVNVLDPESDGLQVAAKAL
jgi:hypothetical protein